MGGICANGAEDSVPERAALDSCLNLRPPGLYSCRVTMEPIPEDVALAVENHLYGRKAGPGFQALHIFRDKPLVYFYSGLCGGFGQDFFNEDFFNPVPFVFTLGCVIFESLCDPIFVPSASSGCIISVAIVFDICAR